MKRIHYLILAAGAVLLISVVAFKRYLPYVGANLGPRETPPVVLTMENVYLVGIGQGSKLWSIHAGKVELSQDRARATVTRISEGKIFDQGRVALKMKAGMATYGIYSRGLNLWNGITLEGNEGQRVSGHGATWDSRTAILRSRGTVIFESKWSKVTAKALEVNLRNRELRMWDTAMVVNLKQAEAILDREAATNAR